MEETKELFQDLEREDEEELLRILKRKQRIDEMKLQKQKTLLIHRCILVASVVVLLLVGFGIGAWLHSAMAGISENVGEDNIGFDGIKQGKGAKTLSVLRTVLAVIKKGGHMSGITLDAVAGQTADNAQEGTSPGEQYYYAFTAYSTETTEGFSDEIVSKFGILVDVEEGIIIAARNPHDRMNPASMTKILTVLTAA